MYKLYVCMGHRVLGSILGGYVNEVNDLNHTTKCYRESAPQTDSEAGTCGPLGPQIPAPELVIHVNNMYTFVIFTYHT